MKQNANLIRLGSVSKETKGMWGNYAESLRMTHVKPRPQ